MNGLSLAFFACFPHAVSSVLEAGDVAFVMVNTDNPDTFAFVALNEIPAGEVIQFTDNGWTSDETFFDVEGSITWTAPEVVPPGQIIQINPRTATTRNQFDLQRRDQLFAYQLDPPVTNSNGIATTPPPIFLAAWSSNGWQQTATTVATSAEPPLVESVEVRLPTNTNAANIQQRRNTAYDGDIFQGRQCELLEALTEPSNWRVTAARFPEPNQIFIVESASSEPGLEEGDIAIVMVNMDADVGATTPVTDNGGGGGQGGGGGGQGGGGGGQGGGGGGRRQLQGAQGVPQSFSFLTLADIRCGEVIRFTDKGWTASDSFRSGEGVLEWTSPSPVARGTLVNVEIVSRTASIGTVEVIGNAPDLGDNGDQLIAFQGSLTQPTVIFALNNNGPNARWQQDSTNNANSANPLDSSTSNAEVAVVEMDNIRYNGATTMGTKSELLAAITNPNSWTGRDGMVFPFPEATFVVSDVPPSAVPSSVPSAVPTQSPVAPPTIRIGEGCDVTLEFSAFFVCLIIQILQAILLGSLS